MKILITGVTGFIGSHLAERLAAEGHHVRCLTRSVHASLPCDMSLENIELWPIDFGNSEDLSRSFEGMERVYHVAGTTRARRMSDYYEGNWALTKRLAEACVNAGRSVDRFVYVSSLSALGPSDAGEEPDETAACHPVSDYGRSKLLAERELQTMTGVLPWVIVRPGPIYGPRDRDLFRYFRMIRKGFYPVIGTSPKFLNMAYCDDVVDGILRAGESKGAVGRTYFIAGARSYETAEIAQEIAGAMKTRAVRIPVPEPGVRFFGAVSEILGRVGRVPVFFNIQKAREACAVAWNCSISRARRELGYNPSVSLDAGIALTYRWYREQGLLAA